MRGRRNEMNSQQYVPYQAYTEDIPFHAFSFPEHDPMLCLMWEDIRKYNLGFNGPQQISASIASSKFVYD